MLRPRVVMSVGASVDGKVTLTRQQVLMQQPSGRLWADMAPAEADPLRADMLELVRRHYGCNATLEGSGSLVTDAGEPRCLRTEVTRTSSTPTSCRRRSPVGPHHRTCGSPSSMVKDVFAGPRSMKAGTCWCSSAGRRPPTISPICGGRASATCWPARIGWIWPRLWRRWRPGWVSAACCRPPGWSERSTTTRRVDRRIVDLSVSGTRRRSGDPVGVGRSVAGRRRAPDTAAADVDARRRRRHRPAPLRGGPRRPS